MRHARRQPRDPRPIRFEPLEPRLLLSADAPVVTDLFADNRGRIEVTVDQDLVASTVTQNAIRVFTAGSDGLLGTNDDQLRSRQVSYDLSTRVIRVEASVPTDERYRVLISGDLIQGANGCFLDGEFNGPGIPTGDGAEGGDLEFFTQPFIRSLVRIEMNVGDVDIRMFNQETPLHVANFFGYMNRGDYDNVVFQRLVPDFVLQGGGAKNAGGFPAIPQDDPVMNEPGISNIRGTVALAKIGGDPNSGTNQFFFNLADNSQNLDNQNGGFTVFAEVEDAASQAVLDEIATFDTVDASNNLGGSFTDVPVLSLQDFIDADNDLQPTNTVFMRRVAEVYDIVGEPFAQLPTQGLQVFESDNGAAKVVVYSLNGVNLGSLNDVIQPVFAGSTLRSLTIRDNPSAPIGIQVISQHKVSIINDLRRDPNASLRFVVSSAPIGRAMLRGPMDGFDINNTLLSDGVLTPEDIDGDGVIGDDTAVYVIGAGIDSLMLEELNGSAVTDEALVNLFVRGETRNADIVSGSTSNVLRSTYRFGDVAFSSLTTTTPIASLTANEWRVQRPGTDDVTAPSVGALRIIGVDGEFNGDLTLTGAGVSDPMPTLGSVLVRGIVFGTTWTIGGGVTSVSLLGGANNWSIDAAGDVGVVSARFLNASAVESSGDVRAVITGEWEGGLLRADSVGQVVSSGAYGGSGDLDADMELGSTNGFSARSIFARGGISGATLRFDGAVQSFAPRGDLRDVDIVGDDFGSLRFGRALEVNLGAQSVRSITASEWIGGAVNVNTIQAFRTTGAFGSTGDFRADFSGGGLVGFVIAGDAEIPTGQFFQLPRFDVRGDLVNSTIRFTQTQLIANAVTNLSVGGVVENSELAAVGTVGTMRFAGLFDTTVIVGQASGIFEFPTSPAQFDPFFTAELIEVRPTSPGDVGMRNSLILGGTLEMVTIVRAETSNGGFAFGVAATELGAVQVQVGSQGFAFQSPTTPPDPIGDFQVRPGFQDPTAGG